MSSKPVTFEERVAKLFRMLSSNSEGEVAAAAHAIARMMKSASPDKIHAVADRIEKANGDGLNKAEAREVFNAGYAEGVRAAENTHHGVNDFHNADGKPAWEAVALFVQRNKDRLDTRHHEFIDNMASRTVWEDYEPTDRMHKYLHSLFFKLGGKIK